jgi:RimJ/RimL family protein N-acetyltransferase
MLLRALEADMSVRLRTKSLILRPLELADAPRMAVFMRAPEIARMASSIPAVQPEIGAEGFILIHQARAPLKREHMFAVELPGEGFIGVGGAHCGKGEVEIAYWLGKPYWGRGFGAETGCALATFAGALGAGPVIAHHFEDNPVSGRVLEKAGFEYTGEVRQVFSLGRGGAAPSKLMVHRNACAAAA